ncbi:MAG: hypothetical protein KIS74_02880 [Burkholderiales bacterium]|nr:hypothetical protein [Burkholderiales bacterium]
MSTDPSGHDLGTKGRVMAALHLAVAGGVGYVSVNAGFLEGLARDVLDLGSAAAQHDFNEDPDIKALLAELERQEQERKAFAAKARDVMAVPGVKSNG